MAEEQEKVTKEVTKNPDLSPYVLMTMPYEQLEENIVKDKESIGKVGIDERHVRVLIFRMLYENNCVIKTFNKRSTLLSYVILFVILVQTIFMLIQVILAVYK